MNSGRTALLIILPVVSAAVIACSSAGNAADPGMPGVGMPTAATEPTLPAVTDMDSGTNLASSMPAIKTSEVLPDLLAAGVDVTKPWEAMFSAAEESDRTTGTKKIHAIMEAFTKSLGTTCAGCHAVADPDAGTNRPPTVDGGVPGTSDGGSSDAGMGRGPRDGGGGTRDGGMGPRLDFTKATPMKNVAMRMWSDWVVGLQFKGPQAAAAKSGLFCDSCHQGKKEFIDRTDEKAAGLWMRQNFVSKLEQKNGDAVTCGTCHGSPFDGDFLKAWEKDVVEESPETTPSTPH